MIKSERLAAIQENKKTNKPELVMPIPIWIEQVLEEGEKLKP